MAEDDVPIYDELVKELGDPFSALSHAEQKAKEHAAVLDRPVPAEPARVVESAEIVETPAPKEKR
jgi:hypothetical protein